jgi:lipoate-protein ligase B
MTCWQRSSNRLREAVHLPLGFADYGEVHCLQRQLHARRLRGEIPDTVLTVEHPPVITIGRRGSVENVLVSSEALKAEGIAIYEVERGGDVTYHGPGQLVVYPIVDLRDLGCDLRWYIRNLEQAVIDLLCDLGVVAERRHGLPGVWVNGRKIASVGVYVKHWVTYHGLALNVCVNKAHFRMIRPCGMQIEVTSLEEIVKGGCLLDEVAAGLLARMEALFGWRLVAGDPSAFREGNRP